MANRALLGNAVTTDIPLETGDEVPSTIDELPPPYEYPHIDFHSGWKDRGFAIAFWLHIIAVIIVGYALGMPILLPYIKRNIFNKQEQTSFDATTRIFVYALGGAAVTGGLISFSTLFLLQLCASRIIICSLIIIFIVQLFLAILLILMVSWVASIIPFILLLIILYYICCGGKRIAFSEAHLRIGCAVLRSHSSLIFVALGMFLVEILWFMFWYLMVVVVLRGSNYPLLNLNNNNNTTLTTSASLGTAFGMFDRKLTPNNTYVYQITNKTFLTTKKRKQYKTVLDSSSNPEEIYHRIVRYIIVFAVIFSWYWGAITFSNVIHFVTAGTVGQWWFAADTGQQYAIRTSVKRALTTNFGTICFGSFFEAVIKALRSMARSKKRKTCVECILSSIEDFIGYLNDWGLVFAALTGESFVEASRSFIELFKKRGWTMVINDTLVEYSLLIINIVVGFVSAIVGCLIVYIFLLNSSEPIIGYLISAAILSFIAGILMTIVMTTILNSCVRTAFVCFALNPAALAATHPEHLQSLTNVWHELHPEEFASSGYDHHLSKSNRETYV